MIKFKVEDNTSILDFVILKRGYQHKSRAKKLFKEHRVIVNGKVETNYNLEVEKGAIVELNDDSVSPVKKNKFKFPFEVVFEDEFYMVINKPAKLRVYNSDGKGKARNVFHILEKYYKNIKEDLPAIYKSVDKDLSGLVILCKTPEAYEALQLQKKDLKERFYVIVEGRIREHKASFKQKVELDKKGVFEIVSGNKFKAETTEFNYEEMKTFRNHSLLRINLIQNISETVRVVLKSKGMPIMGDVKYGAESDELHRLAMHLFSVEFYHPFKHENLKVNTPVPKSFLRFGKFKS